MEGREDAGHTVDTPWGKRERKGMTRGEDLDFPWRIVCSMESQLSRLAAFRLR